MKNTSIWKTEKLKDVAKVVTGKTPSTTNSAYFGGNIPFVSPADLNENILQETKTYLTQLGAEQVYLVPKNTVLVSCIGNLGKLTITNQEVCFNQQINGLIFDETKIFPKYGFYFAKTFKPQLEKASSSTTLPIVNKSKFSEILIKYPPLSEQKRIAEILDKADEIRTQRKQSIQKLDDLLQATFIEMFGDPVLNPKKLNTIKLGEIGTWASGGTPSRENKPFFKGSIPWYTSGELNDLYVSDSIEKISYDAIENSAAKLIPVGSLLLGMYDTAGLKSSITTVESACNQAIAFSKIDENKANILYVYFYIQYSKEYLKNKQRGVRQKNFNLSMIKDIEILFPQLVLQEKFAEIAKSIETQKQRLEKQLNEHERLFQSLQQRAFNGEL